jgi:hypothetical protein
VQLTSATVRKAIIEEERRPGRVPVRSVEPIRGSSRGERAVELCEAMIDITAALFNVPGKELRRGGRTEMGVSRVR